MLTGENGRFTANAWYTPDPLLPLTISLKRRINLCINKLETPDILNNIIEILKIPLDDVDAIPEIIENNIVNAWEELEHLHLEIGHGDFPLTSQEQLFFSTFRDVFQTYWAKAEEYFHKLMCKSSSYDNSRKINSDEGKELSCFFYIRKIELRLRSLVEKIYRNIFGNKWLEGIRTAIGNIAYENALNTMRQRGVSDINQLLHYNTLSDLHETIKINWNHFSSEFTFKKKREFNRIMAPILKGRTEEAHNRPDHLWPQIERDRVRVVCHD